MTDRDARHFRSTHDEASLGVGGDDPAGSPKWEGSECYGSAEDASFLPGEEALALLRLLVAAYRDTSTSPPSP